jgi:integrase/recombinase XerD
MAGNQAKILSDEHLKALLNFTRLTRYPLRNRAIILLSTKAGLRAGEIAKLTWAMVLDPNGNVGNSIELHDRAAKKRSGRRIPMHPDLQLALTQLRKFSREDGPVIRSERSGALQPGAIVNWFATVYRELNLEGCSSHSGRRTFITRAAKAIHKSGGSLRDVQLLAGHRALTTTQRYIEGDSDAQRRLVSMI